MAWISCVQTSNQKGVYVRMSEIVLVEDMTLEDVYQTRVRLQGGKEILLDENYTEFCSLLYDYETPEWVKAKYNQKEDVTTDSIEDGERDYVVCNNGKDRKGVIRAAANENGSEINLFVADIESERDITKDDTLADKAPAGMKFDKCVLLKLNTPQAEELMGQIQQAINNVGNNE